ncbi:30S ribosomal protein S3 [bacterium]|nr:30S ribosomal protein S3 [bacterium]
MAHKVHPKIFRVKETSDWNSRGFYEKDFAQKLEQDFKIRQFLKKKLGSMGIEKVEIERFPGKINVIISTIRPGFIIGRGGKGIEELKEELEKEILRGRKKGEEIRLEVREVKTPWASATLTAQWMAQQIEKRIPYRRVLKQALNKVMSVKGVKGCRVQVSGRLNGVEIARKEWLQKGRLPRQTIRADIDYAHKEAYCSYGVIGVKVWIYKGDKF